MFKRIFPMCLAVPALLMIAGCTDPVVPDQEALAEYPQIYLSGYGLKSDIRVDIPRPQRVGAGQLQVDITIRNVSGHELNLEYKYYFTDANKVPIERDTSWQGVRIAKGGIESIHFSSLTAAAADFRVELRRQKYIEP